MRKFLLLIIIVFLAGCKTSSDLVSSTGYFDTGGRTTYQDKDWNVEFYDNCDLPDSSSVRWVTEGKETFLRFTLKNGQVGGCSTDAIARAKAPFWERAEMKQANTLKKGDKDYVLTFRARFLKGFTFARESFLQIHQGVPGCRVGPAMMFRSLGGYFGGAHIADIIGKWINVRLNFNLEKKQHELYFDDKRIFSSGYYFREVQPCGEPFLKFGIYRPGDEEATGERISIVDFDKINLVEIKNK